MGKPPQMRTHASDTLASIAVRLNSPARLFDLDRYLRRSEREAKTQITKLLPSQSLLLELASSVMLLLTRYVTKGPGNEQRNAFAGIQSRAVNDLLCSRRLLETGFEESARSTTRSYLESIDIALACVVDADFANAYADFEGDQDDLWKNQIGYGRIYKQIEKAMSLANMNEAMIVEKIARRRTQKTSLSRSIHGDFSSAFRSLAPSPLGYPDMISLDPHGVISVNTADHTALLIIETYEYCSVLMRLMLLGTSAEVLNRPKAKRQLRSYSVHFFTFQELVCECEFKSGSEIVAPDYVHASDEGE